MSASRHFLKSILKSTKQYESVGSAVIGFGLILGAFGVAVYVLATKLPDKALSFDVGGFTTFFQNIAKTMKKDPFVNEVINGSSSSGSNEQSENHTRRTHKTIATDTLWKLAVTYYNDGNKWTQIYEANKKLIPNPNALEKDIDLVIP
jgi:nucleoid-associated protein YgaU